MKQPIEMVGHVVEPAAGAPTGKRPLVLFLHGRHVSCYQAVHGESNADWPCHGTMREVPSQLGYDYAQRLLASQGFTTVSIRANGINAQDYPLEDAGASARATLVVDHLNYWATIAEQHDVDLSRVVLIGHSRGGEGVDRAAIRIPATAPYRIVGQVLIAPTDFASQAAPYIPTVTMLPYCDGDVGDLQGQQFTDTGRDVVTDDLSLKSSVLVMGANHNFFNTQWTPGIGPGDTPSDDWFGEPTDTCGTKTSARLTAAGQRSVAKTYIAGAVGLFTNSSASSLLPMFNGSPVKVRSAGKAVVLSHAIGGGRDVRRPYSDTTLTATTDGMQSRFCAGVTSIDFRPELCGSQLVAAVTPHWRTDFEGPIPSRRFWQLSWTKRGQAAGLQLERPLDLRSRSLDLRTIVDYRLGAAAIKVRLTDGNGAMTELEPEGGETVRPLPASAKPYPVEAEKLWAQTVRVDPRPTASHIDLSQVTRVEIIGDSTRGRLWIADLAAGYDSIAPIDDRRAPTLSIGTRRVKEGNSADTTVVDLPYRLSRPLDRPGQFRVVTTDERSGKERVLTVDLAPGQRSGTIPVGYQANRLDSPDQVAITVKAYATRSIATDDFVGQLIVLDDDPSPAVAITRVHGTVHEGQSARWKITLSRPIDYDLSIAGTVELGPGRDLTGADVPLDWLTQHAAGTNQAKTLAALDTQTYGYIRSGARSTTISIPVRHDHKKEPREAVTAHIATLHLAKTSTIAIAASR